MLEFVVEDLGFLVVREVAVGQPPPGERVRHPVRHLPERPLALGGVQRPAEVLLRQDVGGVHTPEVGHLDAELLEDHLAVAIVGDAGIPPLPADLVVGMYPSRGEVSLYSDCGSLGGDGHSAGILLVFSVSADSGANPDSGTGVSRRMSHPAPGGGEYQHNHKMLWLIRPCDTRCGVHYSTVVTPLSMDASLHRRRSWAARDG